MRKVFYGIGGGDMRHELMRIHYPRIVELAREQFDRNKPVVTILPTAHWNGTNKKIGRGWMDFIVEKFEMLGCTVGSIWIGDLLPGYEHMSPGDVSEILERSDALFVLGGDTRYLIEVVRDLSLVGVFTESYERGTVFAGSSAGLIWFSKFCLSDSESFHKDDWNYIMLEGLGVFPFAVNAHDNGDVPEGIIDERSRKQQFEERFLTLGDIPGLAVDEMAAIEVVDGMCKVRTAAESIGAGILFNEGGEVRRTKIRSEMKIDFYDKASLMKFALG